MLAQEIIRIKREGAALAPGQIQQFVRGLCDGADEPDAGVTGFITLGLDVVLKDLLGRQAREGREGHGLAAHDPAVVRTDGRDFGREKYFQATWAFHQQVLHQ